MILTLITVDTQVIDFFADIKINTFYFLLCTYVDVDIISALIWQHFSIIFLDLPTL